MNGYVKIIAAALLAAATAAGVVPQIAPGTVCPPLQSEPPK